MAITDIANSLREALKVILRPIVRFCLRHSISIQDLIEACKVTIIEVAAEDIEDAGQKVSVSRLRVLTGMHRRDVARIYRDEETIESSQNYMIRVINRWQHDPEFLTKAGKPRVLSYETEDSDFTYLVSVISKDVHASAVLFNLERIGAIEKTQRGLSLVVHMFNPKNDPVEGFKLYARDSGYLLQAVEENIWQHKRNKNHHILTEYNNLRQDELKDIKKWVFEKGSDFHRKLRQHLSKYDQDLNYKKGKKGGGRIVFGSFGKIGKNDDFY